MSSESVKSLVSLLRGRRIVALTGAGCSTESGIPDYRGPETRHKPRNPIRGPDFAADPKLRHRYWARAMIGWDKFSRARPNAGHLALAELERRGDLLGIITQNVDRLHASAGSRRVIELHGALAEVRCLECGVIEARDSVQARLRAKNPGFEIEPTQEAPDGDVDLPESALSRFQLVACAHCDGALKPHVVFFGDSVPRPIVDEAFALVDQADVLLVVGTSLAVFSGYRFVLHASKKGIPLAFVNLGTARGLELAEVVVEGSSGEILPMLLAG